MMSNSVEKKLTVSEIKKLWTYKKLSDGTLAINKYKGDAADVAIPAVIGNAIVSRINDDAFKGNTVIRSVCIPEGINWIGVWAFENCSNLEIINIPHGVPVINWGTFSGCSKLKTLVLPDSVTQIDYEAFDSCTALETLYIPRSTVSIRSGAFPSIRNCPNLTIHAPVGSYAESFAKENSIFFVAE